MCEYAGSNYQTYWPPRFEKVYPFETVEIGDGAKMEYQTQALLNLDEITWNIQPSPMEAKRQDRKDSNNKSNLKRLSFPTFRPNTYLEEPRICKRTFHKQQKNQQSKQPNHSSRPWTWKPWERTMRIPKQPVPRRSRNRRAGSFPHLDSRSWQHIPSKWAKIWRIVRTKWKPTQVLTLLSKSRRHKSSRSSSSEFSKL